MKRTALAAAALLLAAAAPAPRPHSVLDLSTAPGRTGREGYAMMVIATFAPVIAEAPDCLLRSRRWASGLETYITVILDAPRHGIAEPAPSAAQDQTWLAEMHQMEQRAHLRVLRDPKGTCARIAHDQELAVGDWFAARAKAFAKGKDPWAGAGGVP